MKKPMWNSEAVKAYETGQGVELVTTPHPHYRPLPKDLNPDSFETVEIELPERTWVDLTDDDIWDAFGGRIGTSNSDVNPIRLLADARKIEAKLKEKNS